MAAGKIATKGTKLLPDMLTPDMTPDTLRFIRYQLFLIWLLSPNFEVEWVGN